MKIIVSCTDAQKEELTATGVSPGSEIIYIANDKGLINHTADAYIDLQFENKPGQVEHLEKISEGIIIVNSIVSPLREIHPSFIRINAWPTFLSGPLIEASCLDEAKKQPAESIFALFNKKIEWLPDEPGLVTARIISMIINEAYFALSEGISTKEEMDTAMKLGTNYPFGPFEWAHKIGLNNIAGLLTTLSQQQGRYTPCELLVEEFKSSQVHKFTS